MIEAAFVLVPMLAVFLAIIDFGFAIFLKSTFQHAVREGVRYAITGQTLSGQGQDASIKSVVQKNAVGFLNGASGAAYINIQYYDPITLAATTSNQGGNIVEVSVQNYPWNWIAPITRDSAALSITAKSSDRMEPFPGGVPPPR